MNTTVQEFTFDADILRAAVQDDGSIMFHVGEGHWVKVEPDEFARLVEAQQHVVWAAQHWTSLAAVSDSLDSLLTLYPSVQVDKVMKDVSASGSVYYLVDVVDTVNGAQYRFRCVEDVQKLLREQIAPK